MNSRIAFIVFILIIGTNASYIIYDIENENVTNIMYKVHGPFSAGTYDTMLHICASNRFDLRFEYVSSYSGTPDNIHQYDHIDGYVFNNELSLIEDLYNQEFLDDFYIILTIYPNNYLQGDIDINKINYNYIIGLLISSIIIIQYSLICGICCYYNQFHIKYPVNIEYKQV